MWVHRDRDIGTHYLFKESLITMLLALDMLSISQSVGLTVLGTLLLALMYYVKSLFKTRNTLPKLFYKDSALNDFLLNKCAAIKRPFRPTFWASNAHVQTLVGVILPEVTMRFDREYIQMSDKGITALDWAVVPNVQLKRSSPILIIFPALTSGANSVTSLISTAAKKGFRTVVFNHRGHGDSFLATSKLQSFGDPTDVRQCILYIKQKHTRANMVALSLGSGSTTLFSYLGEFGSSSKLKAASFISPIYETEQTVLKNVPLFYQFLTLLGLKKVLVKHAKPLSKVIDIQSALNSWDLLDYQQQVYCKMCGVTSLEQFLERNDPMRDVDDISVPVLCINSTDDPICKQENIPFDIFQFYPNMVLVATERGGHCGFWEGTYPHSWSNKVATDYLNTVLEFVSDAKLNNK